MDVISFSEAATANSRIEIINANPDSTSGIVTVPKTIASGENVTIPAGRVAILPNVQVDGILNIENDGEVFVPSGATFGDLEAQIALKQNVLVANDPAVKTALNATGTAPIYACRAWVNFNGTGTVAIRASGNVSSITDNGVGHYAVNFTTAMPDTNYSIIWGNDTDIDSVSNFSFQGNIASRQLGFISSLKTTSSFTIYSGANIGSGGGASAKLDFREINISIFR